MRATIKTVNHRFFNPHLRTPPGFDRLEGDIQAWLKGFFSRGHVNLTLALEKGQGASREDLPALDLDRARHYKDLLDLLRRELDLGDEVGLASLLRFGELFRIPEAPAPEDDMDPEVVREVVEAAAAEALAMREREGALLLEDLEGRLTAMERELGVIEARAPQRLVEERDRIQAAISELSEAEDVDEDRIAREVAYLAERWDINEELVRFRAHLGAFRKTVAPGETDPVGKRLGFLVQEMHREANTIASKANDVEMGHASVAIREEIERLREQLENVE